MIEEIRNNNKFRVIKETSILYPETYSHKHYEEDGLEIVSYVVQMKLFFIWITIKEYTHNYFVIDKERLKDKINTKDKCVKNKSIDLYNHLNDLYNYG